jgi:hypothetical protein
MASATQRDAMGTADADEQDCGHSNRDGGVVNSARGRIPI